MKAKYTLHKRGKVWYYRLPSDPKRTPHSTRESNKGRAALFVETEVLGLSPVGQSRLGEFAADFFVWNGSLPTCPHCSRVLASGGQIGPEHAQRQRRLLERFIIGDNENEPDPISYMSLGKIRRGDCIDFRDRVLRTVGANIRDRESSKGKRVINSVMVVLSTVFSEAVEREHIESNPAARLAIRYARQQRGSFSAAELRLLFSSAIDDLGPWPDLRVKSAFLTAGACGLRRNEIRALKWSAVDFELAALHVTEAFKGNRREGLPKWDKRRTLALPGVVARHLLLLKRNAESEGYVLPTSTDRRSVLRSGKWHGATR